MNVEEYYCVVCMGMVPVNHVHDGLKSYGQLRWDFETGEII